MPVELPPDGLFGLTMRRFFGASWRTGFLGLMALCSAAIPLVPDIDPRWGPFILAIVTGLGLMASKDGNVTGGTKPNDKSSDLDDTKP